MALLLNLIGEKRQIELLKKYKSVPPPEKIHKEFLMEFETLKVLEKLCPQEDVELNLIDTNEFLRDQKNGINLLFEGVVESFLYHESWDPPFKIDGRRLLPIMGDKYETYKKIKLVDIPAPLTLAIRGHKDLVQALDNIKTKKLVLKPRFWSYASANVLIIEKNRLNDLASDERLNLKDFVLQEYLPETLFPSVEWRFHFVGRSLCRVIKTIDKNNWNDSFSIQDVTLKETPDAFSTLAQKVAEALTPNDCDDNFTLDFLATETGLLFLEANVGTLNSMFIHTQEEAPFLEPIYKEIFARARR